MVEAIRHRGPDGRDFWSDDDCGLTLGHARLAIIDLSDAGRQPMTSASGRYTIVLNGEIYNHPRLRHELETVGLAPAWRGHSDVETLLAGFDSWGIVPTLTRAVGMFAFALWDRRNRRLILARDRAGEKPLYYGWIGRGDKRAFIFGSELGAIRACPQFDLTIDRRALSDFLRLRYVPAPRTIHQNIYQLEPGCLLEIDAEVPTDPPPAALRPGTAFGTISVSRWWSVNEAVERGAEGRISSEIEALAELEATLTNAVHAQCISDVPLGAFLSGGIDSSTIVALLQHNSGRAVPTYTVGFDDARFDESRAAAAVARHLGTEHHDLRLTSDLALDSVPDIAAKYDEPFADSSQIPTFLICRAARAEVTVMLSGDGGDELFGGYDHYQSTPRRWRQLRRVPRFVRHLAGRSLDGVPERFAAVADTILARGQGRNAKDRIGGGLKKIGQALKTSDSLAALQLHFSSAWLPHVLMPGFTDDLLYDGGSAFSEPLPVQGLDGPDAELMLRDFKTYLPDDILCKVDRAAMAVSLETRVPYLDRDVVELAWRLPRQMKIRNGTTKWALRQLLYRHVPRSLVERPKAGFSVPLGDWLRGPLRDWTETMFSDDRFGEHSLIDPEPVRYLWKQHLRGVDHSNALWPVIVFHSWYGALGAKRARKTAIEATNRQSAAERIDC